MDSCTYLPGMVQLIGAIEFMKQKNPMIYHGVLNTINKLLLLLFISSVEFLNPTGCINKYFLTCIERMRS